MPHTRDTPSPDPAGKPAEEDHEQPHESGSALKPVGKKIPEPADNLKRRATAFLRRRKHP